MVATMRLRLMVMLFTLIIGSSCCCGVFVEAVASSVSGVKGEIRGVRQVAPRQQQQLGAARRRDLQKDDLKVITNSTTITTTIAAVVKNGAAKTSSSPTVAPSASSIATTPPSLSPVVVDVVVQTTPPPSEAAAATTNAPTAAAAAVIAVQRITSLPLTPFRLEMTTTAYTSAAAKAVTNVTKVMTAALTDFLQVYLFSTVPYAVTEGVSLHVINVLVALAAMTNNTTSTVILEYEGTVNVSIPNRTVDEKAVKEEQAYWLVSRQLYLETVLKEASLAAANEVLSLERISFTWDNEDDEVAADAGAVENANDGSGGEISTVLIAMVALVGICVSLTGSIALLYVRHKHVERRQAERRSSRRLLNSSRKPLSTASITDHPPADVDSPARTVDVMEGSPPRTIHIDLDNSEDDLSR